MIGAIAQLGLAFLLIGLLVAGVIVYSIHAALRPGWWRVSLAIAFTLGWLLFLSPFALVLLYAPPWDLALGGHDVAAHLDLCEFVGQFLIIGVLMVQTAPLLFDKNWRRCSTLTIAGKLTLFGAVITVGGAGLGSNLALDPFIRTDPDFVAQQAWVWWLALLWLLAGIVMLVVGQWKLSATTSAASAPEENAVSGAK